nr:retrovirus-related Pol polyprotein from transposon TNT 1-94 [Tanacetum cinerariifolium]
MFPSTRKVSPTNDSGSKLRSDTKDDRIPQPSSRSMENKVEAHHMMFKPSANKNNHVSDCNANVKNVILSKNSDTICLSCDEYMMKSSLICLLFKASKIKSWLWHRRLSHLNFDTIDQLAKQGLIKGIPKLKYTKDQLCLACQMGKSKKEYHRHKLEPKFNMSRTNPQAEIVSEKEQLVHMPPLDPNNTYIKPPSEIQILKFIKTLGYNEVPKTKMISVSKMVATRLYQPWRAILSVLNRCLMRKDSSWDIVERSSRPSKMSKLLYNRFTKIIIKYILSHNKSIPRRSVSKLHSSQDDQPITKLLSTTNGEYKFGMEVLDEMISDAIKKKVSGRGKRFMCYGDQVANVSNKLKKDVVPRKTRSLTIAEETVGRKLKGPVVEDLAVQSLLDLQKGLKASSHKILRKKKQPVTGEGLSATYKKLDHSSDSDATLYSSNGNDDAARYGVFMHNKSTSTPNWANSTYLSLAVTSSSLDFIQTLLDETPAIELMDFMSHPVYTDAQTTLVLDELTIADLKGTRLECLKVQYNNDVELEYHVSQLKAAVLLEAQWNNDDGDVSKPRSFERHMSKSTKPHPYFYNNDYTYLMGHNTKERYTTSITKHYAARYYKEEFLKDFNNALLMFIRRTVIKNKLSEVKKFCDGTLVKIQENMIDMLSKNKLGNGNKRLKERDWTDYDVKSSKEMLKKIDEVLRHKEQLRRLEEYVRGRPKTINPRTFVRPL